MSQLLQTQNRYAYLLDDEQQTRDANSTSVEFASGKTTVSRDANSAKVESASGKTTVSRDANSAIESASGKTSNPHDIQVRPYQNKTSRYRKSQPIRQHFTQAPDVSTLRHNNSIGETWTIWIHDNMSTDWSLESYSRVMSFNTMDKFWQYVNNFNKLNYVDYQFFIMRNTITPTWEDPSNKNGGAASFKLSVTDPCLLSLWENLCMQLVCESIYFGSTPSKDINGISFNLKDTTTVIKIWNANSQVDVIKKIAIIGINSILNDAKLLCRTAHNQKYKIFYIRNRPNK